MKNLLILMSASLLLFSCKKDGSEDPQETQPQLRFSMEFDENLPRLGNFGQPVAIPAGHAAQHPVMNEVSIHYIEFAADSLTPLTLGDIVYKGAETNAGGSNAVDFNQAVKGGSGDMVYNVNLSELSPGTYTWLRVSLTYQNYDIAYRLSIPPFIIDQDYTATLASFVGFNTYISSYKVKDSLIQMNANRLQGYWAIETGIEYNGVNYGSVNQGEGAGVTVVNPISSTSPIPPGSCVVTGKLAEPLVITGNESADVHVVLAFSINGSFEWEEVNMDGKFEPGAGETITDMGLRGLHPYVMQ